MNPEANEASQAKPEQLYTPKANETQLTLRAILAGCLIGAVIAAMNIYLGLMIGWTTGASVMAAILGFALFAALRPKQPFSVLEVNITQTAASAAGTMASAAGLVAPIPAMYMLGQDVPIWALFFWAAATAYMGVMFAVPLRRQYVVIEKLRFPSGTATASTILAMFATAGEAMAKARVLIYFGLFAFIYLVSGRYLPALATPPLHEWLGSAALASAAAWGFSLYLGPMLFGAGFLSGPRVGASLLAGAVVGWAILGYYAQSRGWAPGAPMVIHDTKTDVWGPRGWILWPGVAIMVGDAVLSLALSWRTFVTAYRGTKEAALRGEIHDKDPEAIPTSWWAIGLAGASVVTIVIAWAVFAIPAHLSIIAILLSTVLANVAVRSTGETDINPIGGVAKVTQAVFGALSGSMATNLMSAAITGAGASQAGDMMHDLKTGYLLGASPRAQFKAQLIGILAGVVCVVPIFFLFQSAYEIGGAVLGAPAALAWKAVAQVMSKGFHTLPPHADTAMLVGFVFGGSLPVFRKLLPRFAVYTPSGLAFGIAFIVQAYYSIIMFVGSMFLLFWMRLDRVHCERFVFPVACGLIAGEGMGGILNAIITMIEQMLKG